MNKRNVGQLYNSAVLNDIRRETRLVVSKRGGFDVEEGVKPRALGPRGRDGLEDGFLRFRCVVHESALLHDREDRVFPIPRRVIVFL